MADPAAGVGLEGAHARGRECQPVQAFAGGELRVRRSGPTTVLGCACPGVRRPPRADDLERDERRRQPVAGQQFGDRFVLDQEGHQQHGEPGEHTAGGEQGLGPVTAPGRGHPDQVAGDPADERDGAGEHPGAVHGITTGVELVGEDEVGADPQPEPQHGGRDEHRQQPPGDRPAASAANAGTAQIAAVASSAARMVMAAGTRAVGSSKVIALTANASASTPAHQPIHRVRRRAHGRGGCSRWPTSPPCRPTAAGRRRADAPGPWTPGSAGTGSMARRPGSAQSRVQQCGQVVQRGVHQFGVQLGTAALGQP